MAYGSQEGRGKRKDKVSFPKIDHEGDKEDDDEGDEISNAIMFIEGFLSAGV